MRIDPAISTAALVTAEASINKALEYDPGTRIALAKLGEQLKEQVIAVDITAPKLTLFIAFDENGIRLSGHSEQVVTTRLRGSIFALSQLMAGNTTTLANSGVEIFGSTSVLSKLQAIAANIDIDWEEPITQLLGDLLGHQSAEYIRWRFDWLQQRLKTGLRLGSEFITEENRSLPARDELQYFYQQVDDIRLATDRTEARLNALIKRVKTASQSPSNL